MKATQASQPVSVTTTRSQAISFIGKEPKQIQVGVLGATSLVGTCLLPLLVNAGYSVKAFSRRAVGTFDIGVAWRQLVLPTVQACRKGDTEQVLRQAQDERQVEPHSEPACSAFPKTTSAKPHIIPPGSQENLPLWVCVSPIWTVPDYFSLLDAHGARRVVVLSSTSRFTKRNSADPEEQTTSIRLIDAEVRVRQWAESRGIEWVILRPTLIYGLGQDKNISEIARFIRRFGFFPLFGKADGLRQPIHAADVAAACMAAMLSSCSANREYNLSGGETLTYRSMIVRVFSAIGYPPRLLTAPLWSFRLAVTLMRPLPRCRHWSAAMAERMNNNLVFDHTEASRDLGFNPKAFVLTAEDFPV